MNKNYKGNKKKMNTSGSFNSCISTLKQSRNSKEVTREQANGKYYREQDKVFYMFLHDMKTPLTTSRGFLSRLLSNKAGSLTEKQKEYLEIIYCNHEEIESLLNQFSDILRTRSRHLAPDFSTFDIIALISKIIYTTNIEAEKKA
jgi:signal transduction histidine kinase